MTEDERLVLMLRWWADRVENPELRAVLLQAADSCEHAAIGIEEIADLLDGTDWGLCAVDEHQLIGGTLRRLQRTRPEGLLTAWAASPHAQAR